MRFTAKQSALIVLTSAIIAWPLLANDSARVASKRQAVAEFGTIETPRINRVWPIRYGLADSKTGRDEGWRLKEGAELFVKHCARCHGSTGEGDGPDSEKMTPPPRDLQGGVFKFHGGIWSNKPSRHQISETIRLGLPGTAMPSFEEHELYESESIIEFVRWFAIRGDFANRFRERVEKIRGFDIEDEALVINAVRGELIAQWQYADLKEYEYQKKLRMKYPDGPPKMTAASVARGRKLYMSDKHGCSKCHDEDGHGGTFNKWGVRDSKGRDIKITDITKGVFKGGDGPFDLHHRIRHGIPGSMHPANGFYDKDIGETPGWDLAHFVYHISGTTQSNAKQARRPPKELGIPHRDDELFESAKKEFFQRPKIQLKTIVPEGWGAFRGTVVFDGRPPSPKKLEVDRKRYGVGEIELVDPSLVVHPKTHGLANVVIWFDREQSETLLPVHDSLSEPPSTPSTLESKQYYFTPHVASVRVGQRLQLGCVDQKATNIHIQSDSRVNGFNMILPMGKTYNYESKASEREPLLVTSSIHPWMKSILVIKDHPYFAVTDANGEFEIPKLPAGKWRFRMWHEIPHKIRKVKFDGGIEVDEFRQFVTIQPDQTITTEIRLAPELFEEPK